MQSSAPRSATRTSSPPPAVATGPSSCGGRWLAGTSSSTCTSGSGAYACPCSRSSRESPTAARTEVEQWIEDLKQDWAAFEAKPAHFRDLGDGRVRCSAHGGPRAGAPRYCWISRRPPVAGRSSPHERGRRGNAPGPWRPAGTSPAASGGYRPWLPRASSFRRRAGGCRAPGAPRIAAVFGVGAPG